MPPIPVTFFIFVVLELFCLTIIVLKAKPKQNEVTSPKINIDVLFILSKRFVYKVTCYAHAQRLTDVAVFENRQLITAAE